ncbi:protein kinase domain-containing protein [Proteus hauseri]|uniref:protein kinase domain-containing protein n=1 Tax=Proteus hauseri TaxID=183417 RepID=UPI0032DA350A
MTMIRFCPHCQTERQLTEIFCAGQINDKPCGWDLTIEPIHESGWRPSSIAASSIATPSIERSPADSKSPLIQRVCLNGHPMGDDDFICFECGADAADNLEIIDTSANETNKSEQLIGDWRLEQRINGVNSQRERYNVTHINTAQEGVLTLYLKGEEPDPAIYQVLNLISTEHVPVFYEIGRWDNRVWHVTERLMGGSLSQFIKQGEFWQPDEIKVLVAELGTAIAALTEHGVRHRALRPSNLMIRSREPLDIVVIEYGSACLSEFDLDIVSPLDISRYSAPETLAGGVSAASDWWSLGIILLEQLTHGECFNDIHDNAFLIQVMTNGIELPDNLDADIQLLLRGLLCRDRLQRWQWKEVNAWLQGLVVQAPNIRNNSASQQYHQFQFAGNQFNQPDAFAMVAAEDKYWNEATELFVHGEITTWLSKFDNSDKQVAQLQALVEQQNIEPGLRFTLGLRILNPNMPLIYQGEIITPSWLLENPQLGYQLICEPLAHEIEAIDNQHWLVQLYYRQCAIRERAKQQRIPLNEESLQLYLLITSISQLAARWEIIRTEFPDAHNENLRALIDRQNIHENDYILLLSAEMGQYIAVDLLVNNADQLASKLNILSFDKQQAKILLATPRPQLIEQLIEQIGDFKRVNIALIDQWTDRFLLTRRLPLEHILVMLSIPQDKWQVPESQKYILEVISFFTKKLVSASQRGNLVRMRLTPNAGRVDLTECGVGDERTTNLLEHLINRKKRFISIDSDLLRQRTTVNNRLWVLQSNTQLYQRDTGINGMYLGFPFLVLNTQPNKTKPRIAPLFLWPIAMNIVGGAQGVVQVAFDTERAAVRLNPALANFFGIPAVNEWQKILDTLLSQTGISVSEIMATLSSLLAISEQTLTPLPPLTEDIAEHSAYIKCSAVLFHTSFIGQTISADLQQIANLPINGTALATMLKVNTSVHQPEKLSSLNENYLLSLADPSQNTIIQVARNQTGLLIEGPPGTGKSQTIVNLIADAIGRQKTALVLCQKPAALDVVYKRLVANGLQDRVLIIHQNPKGREIISAIREQLDLERRRQLVAEVTEPERIDRDRIVNLIQFYETTLDAYYRAMYQTDKQYDFSYRDVLSALLALQHAYSIDIDANPLTALLSQFNKQTFTEFIDNLRLYGLDWYDINYENTPLNGVLLFSPQSPLYHQFNQQISGFIYAEQQRDIAYSSDDQQVIIKKLAEHETTLEQCKQYAKKLNTQQWDDVSRWLTLFLNQQGAQNRGDLLISHLAQLNNRLQQIDISGSDPLLFGLLTPLDNATLALLSRAVNEKITGSFLRFFNPFYYGRNSKLKSFIATCGIEEKTENFLALQRTINTEQQWRLLYKELLPVYQQLQIEKQLNQQDNQWQQTLSTVLSQLEACRDFIGVLALYPQPEHFIEAIIAIKQQGFEQQCLQIESAICRAKMQQNSLEKLDQLQNSLTPECYQQIKQSINHGELLTELLQQLENDLPHLSQFQLFREKTAHFSPDYWQILRLSRPFIASKEYVAEKRIEILEQALSRLFYLNIKDEIETKSPVLKTSAQQLQDHIKQLTELNQQLQQVNRQVLTQNILLSEIDNPRSWEKITRLAGPRALRLREFIEQACDLGLFNLRPIWLMTPDVASQILPLKAGLFDSVIYDEASQMPIEFALATLYRGKQAIVSGDEKQMPPSSFFSGKFSDDEDDNEEGDEQQEQTDEQWDPRQICHCPDLLHLARAVLPIHTLDIHYRSAFRELINFSNYAFYENRLNIPAQHSEKTINTVKPLHFIAVNGTYANQSNDDEAKAVVEHLAQIWQKPFNQRPSIGVVTFNQKQAQLINQYIRERGEYDVAFLAAYTEEVSRLHNDEDMSFFVKNVENVQGDERDVILFSTTFGRNAQGTFRRNFGVLGQTGGERRLNVAITRAKQQVVIMSSMPIDEISDLLNTHKQPEIPRDYLQGYLAYASNCNTPNKQDDNQRLLNRLCRTQAGAAEQKEVRDRFVVEVTEFIQSQGYKIAPSQPMGVFYFDCLVEDELKGQLLMGVECDMPQHWLLSSACARELWRKDILRRVVPHHYRVSLTQWFYHREQAQQQLLDALQQAALLNKKVS